MKMKRLKHQAFAHLINFAIWPQEISSLSFNTLDAGLSFWAALLSNVTLNTVSSFRNVM